MKGKIIKIPSSEADQLIEEILNRKPRIVVQDDHFVIHEGGDYSIPVKDCGTYKHILGWIVQLSGKKWADRELIREFVAVATKTAGLDFPHL